MTEIELDGMAAYQDAIANLRRDDPTWPMPSFDAREWAKSFCETAAERGHPGIDVEWMHTWFAGALMRGFDEAQHRPAKAADGATWRRAGEAGMIDAALLSK